MTLNNLKDEIEQLHKSHAELNREVDQKKDDIMFASIVATHDHEKLDWVKDNVRDLHTSIEEVQLSAKEASELLTGTKYQQNRKKNIIVKRMSVSLATTVTAHR